MRRRSLLLGLGLLVVASSAEARMHAPYRGHRLASAVLPLDGTGSFAQPAAAYGLRKLRSAYTGSAIRLRRASDNAELDINFLGFVPGLGSPLDIAAANAHCAATTCTVATWYDQSGNARHATQGASTIPALVFGCQNGLPCARTSTGADYLQVASIAWGVAKSTISAVARRQSGAGICYWTLRGNNSLRVEAATQWMEGDGAGSLIGPAGAEAVFHAATGVIDGAASAVRVDGSETTGTLAGSAAAGTLVVGYAASLPANCDVSEAVIWNNYALTAGERAALTANQRSFWGF